MTNQRRNSIPKSERIIIGCLATSGESVSYIAENFRTNRQFVYTQKKKVMKTIEDHFDVESEGTAVIINERFITRTILSCALECKGSIRNIKQHFHTIFNINVSEGKISRILNEAADKARKFNEGIDLSSIKIGAHDEIFQAGMPVLVGVDPYSTYVYLMESSKKRDGIAWSMAIYEKQENQGLNIETSVTDGGLGMKKGIREVFTDIKEQSDVFHCEMKLTNGLNIYESKAYAAINNEYSCLNKLSKKASKNKVNVIENYEKALIEREKAVLLYDIANILVLWVKEMFSFGGYSYSERLSLLIYLTDEMNNLENKNKQFEDAVKNVQSNKETLLLFVKRAEEVMAKIAKEENISPKTLNLLWQQKAYSESTKKYWDIENKVEKYGIKNIKSVKEKFKNAIRELVRASSIVECINSLIRPYLFLKRTLKGKFLDLLQFYFNTRKYMNSRVSERKGKSPIELLTGNNYGSWIEILGY